MNKNLIPLFIFTVFALSAALLFLFTGNFFYIFNFIYIGFLVSAGIYLMASKFEYGRLMVQLGVGSYMFLYLGILMAENMQIEGFWYYLFLGTFQSAVIHYFVAKVFGPLFFGRGWCGYACWTSMVLDMLPYRRSGGRRHGLLGLMRYVLFFLAPCIAIAVIKTFKNPDNVMFWAFIGGNVAYYLMGVALATKMRDNRAFCKYICPVSIILKLSSYFSVLRVKFDESKCKNCMRCLMECPMDVDMRSSERRKINGTECILCMRCVFSCPGGALCL
ncbi:MAG: 4Fe-4S binding protein [Methanothermobacter sp.]|nr:4Fe-4S binding protein [Methanothermobacter sp.]